MGITSRSLLLRVILFCFLYLDERVVKHINFIIAGGSLLVISLHNQTYLATTE